MDVFAALAERYKEQETRIETIDGIRRFVIINPQGRDNIKITMEEGILFSYSFQHAHFDFYSSVEENLEALMEYIDDFLTGRQVCCEFFKEGEDLFGGSRYTHDIDISTTESLLKSFTGDNEPLYQSFCKHLRGSECRCCIRGWNGSEDRDIDFVL